LVHRCFPGETGETQATVESVAKLFGFEVLGGIGLGLVLGTLTFLSLRSIDDYEIEVMMTLACVMGGYSLASYLHLSAPLANVVIFSIIVQGLTVGTLARRLIGAEALKTQHASDPMSH